MKFWHFSEQSMHTAWAEIDGPTKVTVDNKYCDPQLAHEYYNRYLDEWMVADELGYNIMVNEHHSTATCMTVSAPMALANLAGGQHADTTTFLDHAAPDCASRQTYKTVLSGKSRGVFQGKILVRQQGQAGPERAFTLLEADAVKRGRQEQFEVLLPLSR